MQTINEPSEIRGKSRIPELDALRGLAAISVVLFHFTMDEKQPTLFKLAESGVDVFFIISGFVILMSVEKVENWKVFAWSRFTRLYPAYWICVTITTVLILVQTQSWVYCKYPYEITDNMVLRYIANMTMFQYFFRISDMDGPYWTLLIEQLFYILIIILVFSKKIKEIESIGYLFLLFSTIYLLDLLEGNFYLHKIVVLFPLIKYFPLFYSGIIFYKMKFYKITFFRAIALISALLIQCVFYLYNDSKAIGALDYIIVLLCIYGIFTLLLFDKLYFLVNPVTLWLGQISYSLYLCHQYLGIRVLIPAFKKHVDGWMAITIALLAVLIIAALINRFIEEPSRLCLKAREKKGQNFICSFHTTSSSDTHCPEAES